MLQEWLTRRLSECQFTCAELAERIGESVSTVERWVGGAFDPSQEQIARVAEWLGDPFHLPGILAFGEGKSGRRLGALVAVGDGKRGVGKLKRLEGGSAVVGYFVGPGIECVERVDFGLVRPARVAPQARCYVFDEERAAWKAGRIGQYEGGEYEVNWPQHESGYVDEGTIYVRSADAGFAAEEWLVARAHDTGFFHALRAPLVEAITTHRRRTHSLSGLVSSRVHLLRHQVGVVQRVLSDPVQRYLLADEVGLGKTIEALAIARQHLLDDPHARVVALVPVGLEDQWRGEWLRRFAVYPRDPRFTVGAFDGAYEADSPTLLIIDEAHKVAAGAWEDGDSKELYGAIEHLARSTPSVLLLSATPASSHAREFLAMLHLLDPAGYPLEEPQAFARVVELQQALGEVLMGLDNEDPPFLLAEALRDLQHLLSEDRGVVGEAETLIGFLESPEADPERYLPLLQRLRTRVSESYRLHRRMLRSRRERVQATPLGRGTSSPVQEWGGGDQEMEILECLEQWRLDALSAGVASDTYAGLYCAMLELAGSDLSLLGHAVAARLDGSSQVGLTGAAGVPFYDGEEDRLRDVLAIRRAPSESDELDKASWLIEVVEARMRDGERIVVFASHSPVARALAERLEGVAGSELVARRLVGMERRELHADVERFVGMLHGGVLIADQTGEEGVNLQEAERVVLYDLPFAPNRLEQRLGRLDRLGRTARLKVSVLMGPEPTGDDPTPFEAWYDVLHLGLGLFTGSIASLQFLVDREVPGLQRRLFEGGATALRTAIEPLQQAVREEQRRIAGQDLLDSFDVEGDETDAVFRDLEDEEADAIHFGECLDKWLTNGLQFSVSTRGEGRTYVPTPKTLVPWDLLLNRFVALTRRPVTFDRAVALAENSLELARQGHPLVDNTATYLAWDDRGRAYAFRRAAPELALNDRPPWHGFRFDWVLEADIAPALAVLRSHEGQDSAESARSAAARAALRRRADALLPPEIRVTYVATDGEELRDSFLMGLLQAPFRHRKGGGRDENLMRELLGDLDRYVAVGEWAGAVRRAMAASEARLRSDGTTEAWIECAEGRLERERARRIPTLQLQVERGVSDPRFLAFEEALLGAFLEGIRCPVARVDAVGFIALEPDAH